jgi:NAD(P)-dependent dehydrogenase (short-subunit alcohol dehydrogenase family)
MMELRDAAAIVTGGGRGLGAALALRLSAEGARVVVVARSAEELSRVVAVGRARGGQLHAVEADVGDKRSAHAIAARAAALVGPIDLLVHNASALGRTPLRPWLDTDCETLEDVLAVNLVGPLRLTKLLAGPMVLRKRGAIVHVTSDAALGAYPNWGAYGASKAALDAMARILGAELDGTGVRVVSVDPGEMDTRMHADALPDADRAALLDPDVVAGRVVRLLRGIEALAPGARVEAAAFAGPS